MQSKYIIVLLFCCVYSVLSMSPFFEKGQRSELYELMDNEMPSLRINIPDNEFGNLKYNLSSSLINKLTDIIINVKYNIKLYKRINFHKTFPGYNFDDILPQLEIGKDGYPQYDVEEVFAGFDYDPKHYVEYSDEDKNNLIDMVYKSNKDFDLQEIITKLQNLKMSITEDELYENIGDLSFENWEIEQFNKYVQNSEFKTKNAKMTFEINGNISSFKKVTFKVAGAGSRHLPKPMYNIKIKNGEDLYGRSHFKLRSDMYDPTYLRSKLVSDIRNRVGIKSISANYVQLYINDEYMGLYIMTDVIELPWIEDVYGDKKSTTLYKCNGLIDFTTDYSFGCVNKNEDVTDDSEWINFLKAIESAKSASDLEDIIDIDHLLYEMAIDYLTNAYDHTVHNFYFYKQQKGKWIYISFDFDQDFNIIDYNMSYQDFFKRFIGNKGRLYDLFISEDHERFNNILKDIINKVFNPATLYPHVDEIKQFIKPYVELDKTPNSDGKYPGEINENEMNNIISWSFEEWQNFSEFDTTDGIKYVILQNYRLICNKLNMECDPIYMDENYLNEYLDYYHTDYDEYISYITNNEIPTEYYTNSSSIEPFIENETAYDVDEPTFSTDDESSFDEEDTTESVKASVTLKTITKTQTVIYTTISN